MGSNLVIVAIPEEDDRVWKVSSEKVPHMTLLFLGEADKIAHTDQIVQFVEHAVSTTLNRFYLPVDRRDVLGADEADVLFFKKGRYDFKAIRDFRATLLQDNNIKTAYDSATQFEGPWTPHLTLGYPTAPAKPMPPEWGEKFYSVEFTKIAVWIDDDDGPEFRLKDWWDEKEALECVPMDVAMSSVSQERVQAGLAAIEHQGVKGMRWGVRKTEEVTTAGGKTQMVSPKKAAKLDSAWEQKIYSVPGAVAVHNAMSDHFNQRIGGLNDKYKDDDFTNTAWDKPSSWTSREQKYMKDIDDLTTAGNRAAVKEVHGSSPTGNRHAELSPDGTRVIVKEDSVKHAADDSEAVAVLKVIRSNGLIIKVESLMPEEDTAATHGEAFVAGMMHFGTKGMKWGVRKDPPSAVAPTATSKVPHGDKRKTKIETEGGENHPAHEDAIKVAQAKAKLAKSGPAALSNQELREVAARVQLEQQVALLTSNKGKKFVTQQLQNEGQNLARAGVRTGVKKGVKRAGLAGVGALI